MSCWVVFPVVLFLVVLLLVVLFLVVHRVVAQMTWSVMVPGGLGYYAKWGRLLRSRGLRYGSGNSLSLSTENVPGRTVHFITVSFVMRFVTPEAQNAPGRTVPFVMLCHAGGSKCARKDRPLCHALSRRSSTES